MSDNNSNTTPETLAAFVARMRRWAKDGLTVAAGYVADCVDAAAARERDEARQLDAIRESDEAFARCARCNRPERPGNAAALREALEWVAQFVDLGVDDEYGADGQNILTAAKTARAALAAPARNCDRFATAEEARKAFEAAHSRGIVHNIYTAAFNWLFAEAKGGDHA